MVLYRVYQSLLIHRKSISLLNIYSMNDASADASRDLHARGYDEYLEVLDELEKLDTTVTVPKYRRCCYDSIELLKLVVCYFKNVLSKIV